MTFEKFDADQIQATRRAQIAQRKALRTQILADQQSNVKRDAKALRAEAAWCARQAKGGK